MRSKIPVHHNELQPGGIELLPFTAVAGAPKTPHRDDHYMFMLQQKGASAWTIDFKEWKLGQNCLCFVAPGQVHQYLGSKAAEGWLIFVEQQLIPAEYSVILDTFMYHHQVVSLSSGAPVFALADTLYRFTIEGEHLLYQSILHACVSTLTGMITAAFIPQNRANVLTGSHKYQLVIAFKALIKQQFKETKQVKDYAAQLNITPLYLNELSKALTGFVASYWIQKETLLEAQRLLFYTDMDVKEIAFALGYEDHTYFSRFFKKNTGTTAGTFRKNNHHLSNHNH